MSWPRSFIDEVRRSADGVRIVSEVVALKKRGARWVGLCPFHAEKTPSFTVNDEGLWYCFGCAEGGDVFSFLMRHDGVGFAEAVRSVAERSGISVPESTSRPTDAEPGDGVSRQRIMAALAAAQEEYRAQLAGPRGKRAQEYLQGRGFEPPIIDAFGLGYAPDSWDAVHGKLQKAGYSPTELEAAGLVRRRTDGSGIYDLLRDRIVFPIRDPRGRPIAFSGRALGDGDPKYLNSPETRVFQKSRTLYGMGECREAVRRNGFVLLVEGQLDLLACAQAGFANVVAPLGTAFTADHARMLSRHTSKTVIAFDGDNAGQAAAERTVGIFLAAGFQVSVVRLAAGDDPDSFIGEVGVEGFSEALRTALPALGFLVGRAGGRDDLRSPQGKAKALRSLLGFVIEIEDRVERSEWIARIADALDVNEHLVEQSFADLKQEHRGRASRMAGAPESERAPERRTLAGLERVPAAEAEVLRAVVAHPDWLESLEEIHGVDGVRDVRIAELLDAVRHCQAERGDDRTPLSVEAILARTEMDEAAPLLSRILLERDEEPTWDHVVDCARGIRRDAIRRQMRRLQQQISEAEQHGDRDLVESLTLQKHEMAREYQGFFRSSMH